MIYKAPKSQKESGRKWSEAEYVCLVYTKLQRIITRNLN